MSIFRTFTKRVSAGYRKMSIQMVLSLSFTAVAVAGILLMGLSLIWRFSSTSQQMAAENSQRVLAQVNLNLDSYLRRMMRISDAVYYSVIKNTDLYLAILALLCSMYGMVLIYSATLNPSSSLDGSTRNLLIQGVAILLGLVAFVIMSLIDLETMGKNPDAPIISIGAIFFDPQTGDMGPEFSKTIDLETAGGVIDRDTIKWWLKQSREAQSAIMTDEIPLDDALLQLREFIDENSGEFFVQVWGNGANFDNTILRRSYERQGIPCPWRYYNDRDVRTIVELGKAIDFDARTAIPFEGERHNALDDARYQAKYVSVIWQKLIPSQADF